MGSRAWTVILGIGIGAVVAMGIMTKFAIDSNPALQSIIRFKAALAEEFDARGVSEVSVRKTPRRGDYQLLLTCSPTPEEGEPSRRFEHDVAVYCLKHFPDRSARAIDLVLSPPASLGCAASSPSRQVHISLEQVRAALLASDRLARVEKSILEKTGARLLQLNREGGILVLGIEARLGALADSLASTAKEVEVLARAEYRQERYSEMRVRIRSAPQAAPVGTSEPAPPPLTLEVRYDIQGRRIED